MPCVYLPGPAPAVTVANNGLLRNSVIRGFLELQGIPWNLIPMAMEVLKYRNKKYRGIP